MIPIQYALYMHSCIDFEGILGQNAMQRGLTQLYWLQFQINNLQLLMAQ
jgi:hypothetical protein